MIELDREDAIYLAGLTDGEGSIGLYKKKSDGYLEPKFQIGNQNEGIISWLEEHLETKRCKGDKCWMIILGSYIKILPVLEAIIPFMKHGEKRQKGELLIEFIKSRLSTHRDGKPNPYKKRELEIFNVMKNLSSE